jgi:hypothetical protein
MMKKSTHSMLFLREKRPRSLIIHTTLYDVIAAINAQVSPDEDDVVLAIVVQLLKTHWLTYLGTFERRRLGSARSQVTRWRHQASPMGCGERTEVNTPARLTTPPASPIRSLRSTYRRRSVAEA